MAKKLLSLAVFSFILFSTAGAQAIEKNLDKLAKDPATAAHAARADVYIAGKTIAADSLQQGAKEPAAKTTRKKKDKRKKSG